MKFYAALVISAGLAAAQPVSTPEVTVALFGRVTNAQTHDPVRRAFIKIYTAKQRWDELSDSEGRFKFPPLKRAEYGLAIHRDGYTERYYKIELSDFDNPKELPLELFPQGVITGRVVDGFGQPLEDAEISAILAQQKSPQTPVSNRTTDLGEYRLSGLDPGSYQIRATYREGREHEFDATPISRASAMKPELIVKSGVVVEGIDFTLVPARPVTLRGTVHSESGEAVEKATLWIEGPGPGREGSHNGNANNGKFEFADVGPGNYVIFGDAKAMFGSISIQVGNEELNGIDLVLRPTPMIRGTLRVQSGDSSSLGKTRILFAPSDVSNFIESTEPDSSGSFQVGLHPAQYYISVGPAPTRIEKIILDDVPAQNGSIKIDSSAQQHTLVIVLAPKRQP